MTFLGTSDYLNNRGGENIKENKLFLSTSNLQCVSELNTWPVVSHVSLVSKQFVLCQEGREGVRMKVHAFCISAVVRREWPASCCGQWSGWICVVFEHGGVEQWLVVPETERRPLVPPPVTNTLRCYLNSLLPNAVRPLIVYVLFSYFYALRMSRRSLAGGHSVFVRCSKWLTTALPVLQRPVFLLYALSCLNCSWVLR
jgi:hypothetical protein